MSEVCQTIGLDGDVVPSDDALGEEAASRSRVATSRPRMQVSKGFRLGRAGQQKIVSELTAAGILISQGQQPWWSPGGPPIGGPPPGTPPGGSIAQGAAMAQGSKPTPPNQSPAGNLGAVVGNQPAAPPPQGGPG